MLDKLFRAHSEKNGLGEKNGGAAMNGTASTKENPGLDDGLPRPTPDWEFAETGYSMTGGWSRSSPCHRADERRGCSTRRHRR